MASKIKDIEKMILQLPIRERGIIPRKIISSLDEETDFKC